MALSYTPTTELEAVNLMLESVGELPVSLLDETDMDEAGIAYRMLHQVNREVQSLALHCNSEEGYELTADVDSKFAVPTNALKIDYSYLDKDLVKRGGFLYDRDNHTFVFTDSTIEVDITFFLEFTDLPECVRHYITMRAARRFQMKILGSKDLDGFNAEDETRARIQLFREELLSRDDSLLDNYTPFSIINRRA